MVPHQDALSTVNEDLVVLYISSLHVDIDAKYFFEEC
jgi:hypothetical protein